MENFNKYLIENIENDPEVLVQGYGKLRRSQVQNSIKNRIHEAVSLIEKGNYRAVLSNLITNGVLKSLLETEIQLQDQEI